MAAIIQLSCFPSQLSACCLGLGTCIPPGKLFSPSAGLAPWDPVGRSSGPSVLCLWGLLSSCLICSLMAAAFISPLDLPLLHFLCTLGAPTGKGNPSLPECFVVYRILSNASSPLSTEKKKVTDCFEVTQQSYVGAGFECRSSFRGSARPHHLTTALPWVIVKHSGGGRLSPWPLRTLSLIFPFYLHFHPRHGLAQQ